MSRRHREEVGQAADGGVQELFDRLNRDLFGGRLPRYRVVETEFARAQQGETHEAVGLILIRAGLKAPTRRKVLLHEMCHIGAGPGHGRRFQVNLTRLIRRGESWGVAERERYRVQAVVLRRVPALQRAVRSGSPEARRAALAGLRSLARALDVEVHMLPGSPSC